MCRGVVSVVEGLIGSICGRGALGRACCPWRCGIRCRHGRGGRRWVAPSGRVRRIPGAAVGATDDIRCEDGCGWRASAHGRGPGSAAPASHAVSPGDACRMSRRWSGRNVAIATSLPCQPRPRPRYPLLVVQWGCSSPLSGPACGGRTCAGSLDF